MIKKIALSVFPFIYWVFLLVGVCLLFIEDYIILAYLILNFIALLFFIRLSVILHESGHLFFAKIVGGKPKRMVLGSGHEIIRFEIRGIKVILNSSLKGGFATSNFSNRKYLKWKKFVNIFGGPFTNLMLAALCYYIFGFNNLAFSGEFGLDLSTCFIISNILIGIFSLLPYKVNYYGIKVPTDGLNLLKLPFQKEKDLDEYINEDDFFQGYEYFEAKEYDKAIEVFNKYLEFENTKLVSKINLSVMFLKKGEFEKSFVLLKDCLTLLELDKKSIYKAFVNNNIAWVYLIKKDYKNAVKHSKIAHSTNSKEPNFIGTRASSLIEIGNLNLGISLLKPLVNMDYPNSQTLCASVYLSYGYFLNNEMKKHRKYLKFVLDNRSMLDLDENQILDNILERIE